MEERKSEVLIRYEWRPLGRDAQLRSRYLPSVVALTTYDESLDTTYMSGKQ